ncbi:hypothetical protein B0T16DRAFT_400877 [Cercophora newfieldiana]|uniref:Uncharacterized protein n=1 Tax=Cercophora newfieldiana TaxID=92897 RepID=A0AA40CZE2_9PEZI|nr:hypothetical protein B0T16DRAFT_400877 [Cercophora newfieldiana]
MPELQVAEVPLAAGKREAKGKRLTRSLAPRWLAQPLGSSGRELAGTRDTRQADPCLGSNWLEF